MMFELPSYNELSADEDGVLALALDESAVVVGGPGSGKTLMALYRAKLMHDLGRPTFMLMYNRLLSSYTKTAVKSLGISSIVDTYHHWFPNFWKRHYGSFPPKIDRWTFDWSECKRTLISRPMPTAMKRHLIVDEGQDLPTDLYLLLKPMSRSLIVFADQNQRITEHQSTVADIQAATGIELLLQLRANMRNTPEIAEFASYFDVGLRLGPDSSQPRVPGHPDAETKDRRPRLIAHAKLHEAISYIAAYERANPWETIGVLLPLKDSVRQFYNRLRDKTSNPVQIYLNRSERRPGDSLVDLSTSGLKVITWASCKGLEFDSVFLPELQTVREDPRSDDLRMKLYVACTRARRALTLMYTGEGEPTLVKFLPLALVNDLRS